MTSFARPPGDLNQVMDDLYMALNAIADVVDVGSGVPTHTPVGPKLYFNRTGGVGTAVYAWNGAWVALA